MRTCIDESQKGQQKVPILEDDRDLPLEHISVIEGTAPAIVLQTFESPNLSLPACSVRRAGSAAYCRQNKERLGESNVCKTMASAVPSIIDIYSLDLPLYKLLI